jgi:hypothetical protein
MQGNFLHQEAIGKFMLKNSLQLPRFKQARLRFFTTPWFSEESIFRLAAVIEFLGSQKPLDLGKKFRFRPTVPVEHHLTVILNKQRSKD